MLGCCVLNPAYEGPEDDVVKPPCYVEKDGRGLELGGLEGFDFVKESECSVVDP